jgi:hypothetical protein
MAQTPDEIGRLASPADKMKLDSSDSSLDGMNGGFEQTDRSVSVPEIQTSASKYESKGDPNDGVPEASASSDDKGSVTAERAYWRRLTIAEDKLVKLDAESRGFWGWVRKWGALLALLVGLIGIPKAAVDAWSSLWVHANTSILEGYPIDLFFDLNSQRLSLSTSFTLRNAGTADDVIRSSWAKLIPPRGPELNFESANTILMEKNVPLGMPFTVIKAGSRDLTCQLGVQVKPEEIPRESGVWKLMIELTGVGKPVRQAYHFYLTSQTVEDLSVHGGRIRVIDGIE